MHGNVFEMCRDVWANNQWPDGVDPTGPTGAASANRVRRGGNFGTTLDQSTSGHRMSWDATRSAEGIGVRLVMQFKYLD